MDWYRHKTWTKADEEFFFVKLSRARKNGRAQYLKIQAIELVETKNKELLEVAEGLLNKMLTEYPENKIDKSIALHTLGDIYKAREEYEKAIDYYNQSIEFEKSYPNVQTNSYLDFSELIVKTNKTELFDYVESVLEAELPNQLFPLSKYKMYSILSVINNRNGNNQKASEYADLADENANAETSGLRYYKDLGLVKNRVSWIDKLVKKK
jgi:tetratricopeptide (TPR) repeat protein